MNKILNIGEDFRKKNNILDDFNKGYYTFKKLRDCFDTWSMAKENIYNNYYNLLLNNCDEVIEYGIRGCTRWIITLHAIVIKDGVKYYLMITPSYNWYAEM